VCDHQVAHVYVREAGDVGRVREVVGPVAGRALVGEERAEVGLDHERAGEVVLLSRRREWFAYPFWLDDAVAPDYARAVAIHAKPGFDPCEMFFDPKLTMPMARVAWKVLKKKLGFRMTLDVVPLDASIVRGSHGLVAEDPQNGAVIVGHGGRPAGEVVPMTAVRDLVLGALGLAEE
jgi:hypothetical protein